MLLKFTGYITGDLCLISADLISIVEPHRDDRSRPAGSVIWLSVNNQRLYVRETVEEVCRVIQNTQKPIEITPKEHRNLQLE